MRRSFCFLVAAVCLFLGACGGGGSTPTADAGGAGAPLGPPGAGAPAGGGGEGAETSMPDEGGSPDGGDGSEGTEPLPESSGEAGDNDAGNPPDGGEGGTPDGGGFGRGFAGGGFNEGAFPGGEGLPDGGYGEGGIPDLSAFRMPRQKSLREQAVDAYRAGNESAGFQLLLTHFAVVPEAGPELGEKMAWIPALRRPALGPRIGIVAFYDKPPRDFQGSPMPIGSPELAQLLSSMQQQQQQGGEEGGRRRRGVNRGNPAAGEAEPLLGGENPLGEDPTGESSGAGKTELLFHTGDLGRKFLESLEARISSGDYGAVYKDISEEIARPALPVDPNNPEADPNNPGDDGGEAGAVPGGFPGAEGVPGGEEIPGGEGPAAAPGLAQSLGVGVVWLGKVTSKEEALRLAEQAQVDILVSYEIVIAIPRGAVEFVRNTTKLRISTLNKDDTAFAFISAALVNVTVANAQAKLHDGGKGEDPVDKEIKRAIEALDKFCTACPLPAGVTAEVVQRRLASKVAERPANPLPLVVEARFYVVKGLLPEAEMFAAAMSLMGEAEFSRLIAKSPGSGLGQMIGGALSLPGIVDMVRGANMAAGAAGMRGRNLPGAAPGGAGQPAGGRGLRGLLPFGGSGR